MPQQCQSLVGQTGTFYWTRLSVKEQRHLLSNVGIHRGGHMIVMSTRLPGLSAKSAKVSRCRSIIKSNFCYILQH